MTLFRIRRWGTREWTQLEINDSNDDSSLEEEMAQRLRLVLSDSGLHAQECGEDGEWEDVE